MARMAVVRWFNGRCICLGSMRCLLYTSYTLVVSAVGYTKVEKKVKLVNDERMKLNITIAPEKMCIRDRLIRV